MVDYLGPNGAVTTADANVRVGAGGSIGEFSSIGLQMTTTSGASLEVYGSIWGAIGVSALDTSGLTVTIHAGGSIAGVYAVSAIISAFSNEGSVSGSVYAQASSTAALLYNYGTMTNFSGLALSIASTGSTLYNPGSMTGFDRTIVYGAAGEHRIDNSGTISATAEGTSGGGRTIDLSNGTLTLNNTGRISADIGSLAVATAGGTDRIVNQGLIVGNVSLAGGDDRYDGALGTLAGRLDLGAGNDTAIGGAGGDRFFGGDQRDVLSGGGGDDVLDGGTGNDTLDGGSGDDVLTAGDGTDVVDGGSGDDVLTAGEGADTLDGGSGDDVLDGGIGNDALDGGSGDDVLTAGDGTDTLTGGTGIDRMTGGADDDIYYVDAARDVVVEAVGGGKDTVFALVDYMLRAGVEVEMLAADPAGDATGLALTGNAFAQTITGDAGANRITGGGGADTLIGLAGDDTYIVSDTAARITERGSEGTDTVLTSVSYTLPTAVEMLQATGSAAIDLTGNGLDNMLVGNAGANVLDGGAGADQMVGRLGNDTYVVDSIGDAVSDSGGSDTVRASIDYTLGAAIETLVLTGAGDIDGTGNARANTLIGNDGANVLSGRGGLDTLTGGAGADTFLFAARAAAGSLATITDFAGGTDRIALDDAAFRRIGGEGALGAAFFTDGEATTRDHHILFDAATGTLSYDADGSGTVYAAIAFAVVQPGVTLTAADILVV